MRVEKVVGGFVILVPAKVAEEWALHDGSAVEVNRVGSVSAEITYAGREETGRPFPKTPDEQDAAYRELARQRENGEPQDVGPVDWWKL